MLKLHQELYFLPGPSTLSVISEYSKFFPVSEDCVEALDGTHIPVHVPEHAAALLRSW